MRMSDWRSDVCSSDLLAATLPDLLLVALHRESGYGDHRYPPEIVVLFQPFGHLQPRNFRELDVHEDEVGSMFPRDRQGLDAVARLQRPVAMGFQKVVEQLHIELVVLDDEHCLRHTTSSDPADRKSVV